MAPSTPTAEESVTNEPVTARAVPAVVDWFVATGIALVGCVLAIAGVGVTAFVERGHLEPDVGAVETSWTVLSHAESVEVAMGIVEWTGIGLLVGGAALLIAAVGYLLGQHRRRRATATAGRPANFWANAIAGGVVTLVLGFVPLSPVLGGGIAGRLQPGRGSDPVSVGAAAGGLAILPAALVAPFVLWGLTEGALAVEAPEVAVAVGGLLTAVGLVVLLLTAVLGALGGYVAARL